MSDKKTLLFMHGDEGGEAEAAIDELSQISTQLGKELMALQPIEHVLILVGRKNGKTCSALVTSIPMKPLASILRQTLEPMEASLKQGG